MCEEEEEVEAWFAIGRLVCLPVSHEGGAIRPPFPPDKEKEKRLFQWMERCGTTIRD